MRQSARRWSQQGSGRWRCNGGGCPCADQHAQGAPPLGQADGKGVYNHHAGCHPDDYHKDRPQGIDGDGNSVISIWSGCTRQSDEHPCINGRGIRGGTAYLVGYLFRVGKLFVVQCIRHREEPIGVCTYFGMEKETRFTAFTLEGPLPYTFVRSIACTTVLFMLTPFISSF